MSSKTNQSILGRLRTSATALRENKVLRRIFRTKTGLIGASITIGLVMVAIFAPEIAPYDPIEQNYGSVNQAPSLSHPFGTDRFGRDIFSRVIYGSRYALGLGVGIVAVQVLIGVPLGLIAGYYGGHIEAAIMRLVDITLAIPGIVLALAIAGMLGGGLVPLIVALAGVGWRGFARLVRGDVKSVMEEEYIEAANAAAVSDVRIMLRHILPNASASIIVYATLTLPSVILQTAALSFLGLGIQAPAPEWGAIIEAGRGQLATEWWISTFPGFAIMIVVIGFNALGDSLRDALDPKQSRPF
ncbi:ABC transporter permease [Natrialba sp. INN-245]|uniref:ABC transporter permease n=1 Tax=Natrialba sp. INN-245 TaxID=2690967 RepID=UPI0013108948|nr:ABC transporter permease [Natrialba sp. INN-245]MWV41966.1 ABC transporter permease subunit [Natrialba sp. INN-245]